VLAYGAHVPVAGYPVAAGLDADRLQAEPGDAGAPARGHEQAIAAQLATVVELEDALRAPSFCSYRALLHLPTWADRRHVAGLELEALYGNFDRTPLNDQSREYIFVAVHP
jgi:hypothetical protein